MGNIIQFLAHRFFEVLGRQMYQEIKIKCFVFCLFVFLFFVIVVLFFLVFFLFLFFLSLF